MTKPPHIYDAIILGAGGAGLMCAAIAGQRGRRVLLLDHADQPGKKILISGGGRCNFTNLHTTPSCYLSANPHFAKSALGRYQPQEFIALVNRHGIAWHEKTLGQLFCDGSAKQIVAMLLDECAKGDVTLRLSQTIRDVRHADGHFHIKTDEQIAAAPALVIATGGPSIPKMGATGFAYDLARQFGLKIVQPKPALVPLTLPAEEKLFSTLSGVSADVVARCGRTAFREACLFTHKGLSGPAILQISSYWTHEQPIAINFLPESPADWLVSFKRHKPRVSLRTALASVLPDRLAAVLADRLALPGELANCTDRALRGVEQQLAAWPFQPNGTEGFAKAEVTAGGISTAALSSRTMEAKEVPGLYAIGEAVDVTGWLGGYNFQWAWASGYAAGEVL
ncbi:NAD(P)/FAD-dependent oxidoreductase [Filomicrobium sp.]|uniref:NAD(P)/FAD-dependent oxidoreductase n=1 Tax=Filomicrobium sp. TaxID=2024831 RepID=UPI002585EC70|nr:NAD(P)/FAD-dependent oxidoreductase [Filomicrobium sp.]MCV0368560.1 NAD(P)/FAD-dependent oxidoreductase [Filomicrobium sp.]